MVDLPHDMTVDRLTAGIPGERTAVVSAGGTLSYAEFDAAVNHIAQVLRDRNVERDECVAVIVPRSPELIVAIHGILRAGAAYVPIDPEHPVDTYSYDHRRERRPRYRRRNRIRRNS